MSAKKGVEVTFRELHKVSSGVSPGGVVSFPLSSLWSCNFKKNKIILYSDYEVRQIDKNTFLFESRMPGRKIICVHKRLIKEIVEYKRK